MANVKISELPSATTVGLSDVFPIVQGGTTKQAAISLLPGTLTLGTEQAATAGTALDFTVPSGVRHICVMFSAVSLNGSASWLIQLGDAGGIETGSYVSGTQSGTTVGSSTTGFLIANTVAAADSMNGCITLYLENSSAFRWVYSGALCDTGTGSVTSSAGVKATSQELTTVRITTVAGTATFDAGVINISYE